MDVVTEIESTPRSTQETVAPVLKPAQPVGKVEHDVFILRIGKKGLVGEGEKSDIQLEMRTPKGRERKPPVRLQSRQVQTEVAKQPLDKGRKKKK